MLLSSGWVGPLFQGQMQVRSSEAVIGGPCEGKGLWLRAVASDHSQIKQFLKGVSEEDERICKSHDEKEDQKNCIQTYLN